MNTDEMQARQGGQTLAPVATVCADCGALAPVAAMLRCRETGELYCLECNGSLYDPHRARREMWAARRAAVAR